jgi:hydrogenase maturation protein HypF
MAAARAVHLVRISVRGVVQGVGFRPFVYQLAHRHKLNGWVLNTSGDVRIEVEGAPADIEAFIEALGDEAPGPARIEGLDVVPGEAAGHTAFEIRDSLPEPGDYQLVSPDLATCEDCRRELFDARDRRYRYPFTNCTNCGPRFTIIKDIPYDRPLTTMKSFEMCDRCREEYENPDDRRFHAQPNACPVCGPRVRLLDAAGQEVTGDDAITSAVELLKEGKTVAVKGLGGFLLACDATDAAAVARLRERKRRPAKPFAVMITDLNTVKQRCEVNEEEAALLTSPGSPIVLLKWKGETGIVEGVAPGLDYLGVMLPYTPLHHLLMAEAGRPLVMTSGNRSEEPIAKDNDEALRRLGDIADYFLVHDRDIASRYDDSVMTVERGAPRYVRRARGAAPYPVRLPFEMPPVLACGAEEKNTFTLTRDRYAFISQHIGDMENLETLEHFQNTIELYEKLFRITPELVVHDLHPDYLPTQYAKERAARDGLPLLGVQHHHAHIAACLADNGVTERVIGVSFDGTGYGPDGHVWGGEFLLADCRDYERAAHLEYLPLPGGAQAIKRPYRTAVGYLAALGLDADLPFVEDIPDEELAIVREQAAKRLNTPLTSSVGRLFDAVAAMTRVRGVIQYEAQAAIDLETLAARLPDEDGSYPFEVGADHGERVIRVGPLLGAVAAEVRRGTPAGTIAARFHDTVTEMIVSLCKLIAGETGLTAVALSGGVFQNRLLAQRSVARLEAGGFIVYTHRQVPCNDGGISLGQAAVTGARQEVTP